MNTPEPLSREVLDRARAYVRVDQQVLVALPEPDESIRAFRPVPGPAGESVAEWLAERALNEPQEATVRRDRAGSRSVRQRYGRDVAAALRLPGL